jgi:hypothetical protein
VAAHATANRTQQRTGAVPDRLGQHPAYRWRRIRGWVHFWQAAGKPFLISNLQGGHALRQGLTGRTQQAVDAEGLGDAFAEVDKRWTRRPGLQLPSSAQAGHGDVDASCGSRAYRTRPTIGEATICVAGRSSSKASESWKGDAPPPCLGTEDAGLHCNGPVGRSHSPTAHNQRRGSCLPQ